MQHFQSLENVHLIDAWLTIGAFDGVHRGHQEIIRLLLAGANDVGAPAVVLTFDPHPLAVLRPQKKLSFLTTPKEKASLLGGLGVNIVITHPFNPKVAALSAKDFLIRLKNHLGFRHFWIGHDFAMGHNREGDIPTLRRLGSELGYELNVASPATSEGQTISSSRIRALLAEGKVQEASHLLGRPYQVSGKVIEGVGRGHEIGFPTANLDIPANRVIPQLGVYACRVYVNGRSWEAVTNIGVRPTFETDATVPSVETHILDFSEDVYGDIIQLEFVTHLRGEQRFSNVAALTKQINTDMAQARAILSSIKESAHEAVS